MSHALLLKKRLQGHTVGFAHKIGGIALPGQIFAWQSAELRVGAFLDHTEGLVDARYLVFEDLLAARIIGNEGGLKLLQKNGRVIGRPDTALPALVHYLSNRQRFSIPRACKRFG